MQGLRIGYVPPSHVAPYAITILIVRLHQVEEPQSRSRRSSYSQSETSDMELDDGDRRPKVSVKEREGNRKIVSGFLEHCPVKCRSVIQPF